jgi:hypothetical protein
MQAGSYFSAVHRGARVDKCSGAAMEPGAGNLKHVIKQEGTAMFVVWGWVHYQLDA